MLFHTIRFAGGEGAGKLFEAFTLRVFPLTDLILEVHYTITSPTIVHYPSLSSLKQMISICEEFAKCHSIVFNPSKTKLLCFNLDPLSAIPPIFINGVQISIVEHEKHLGNYVSTNISDRNIIANVCDLYQRSNLLISDFRVCDSQTLDCLHKTYCMHMYGSELWNLNCNYVDEFRVAWRKIKWRIWRLPNRAHNEIVQNLILRAVLCYSPF